MSALLTLLIVGYPAYHVATTKYPTVSDIMILLGAIILGTLIMIGGS